MIGGVGGSVEQYQELGRQAQEACGRLGSNLAKFELPVVLIQTTPSQQAQATVWQDIKQGVLGLFRQLITFFEPSTASSKNYLNSQDTLEAFEKAESNFDIREQASHQRSHISTVLTRHGLWDGKCGDAYRQSKDKIEDACVRYTTKSSTFEVEIEKCREELELLGKKKSLGGGPDECAAVDAEIKKLNSKIDVAKAGMNECLKTLREEAAAVMKEVKAAIPLISPDHKSLSPNKVEFKQMV
ncbi:hypothetical protein [Pseudomonas alkylphenolica]|uniref:hypothetical protein n=1 Tax=Pseudomonas alkylphenolica TaxID=237609 RepID=UPI00315CFE33